MIKKINSEIFIQFCAWEGVLYQGRRFWLIIGDNDNEYFEHILGNSFTNTHLFFSQYFVQYMLDTIFHFIQILRQISGIKIFAFTKTVVNL